MADRLFRLFSDAQCQPHDWLGYKFFLLKFSYAGDCLGRAMDLLLVTKISVVKISLILNACFSVYLIFCEFNIAIMKTTD